MLFTTNKSIADWNDVLPSGTCVAALLDRLVHHAEIIGIKGQSYRKRGRRNRPMHALISIKHQRASHEEMA
jgi:DNA replication protein DnaC